MGIADTPEFRDSSNQKILPPHISALDALRKVDKPLGKGTLARWIAGELVIDDDDKMHPDLEVNEIEEIIANLEVEAAIAKLALKPGADPAAAARDVAKTLGAKPNDPIVEAVLAEKGVKAPLPTPAEALSLLRRSLAQEKPSAKSPAPWKGRDREDAEFAGAVSAS